MPLQAIRRCRASFFLSVVSTWEKQPWLGSKASKKVTSGFRRTREINTVVYDPQTITEKEMIEVLKRAGTCRGAAGNDHGPGVQRSPGCLPAPAILPLAADVERPTIE
jgi:hypothetical protein